MIAWQISMSGPEPLLADYWLFATGYWLLALATGYRLFTDP